jgi:hypothetical protein
VLLARKPASEEAKEKRAVRKRSSIETGYTEDVQLSYPGQTGYFVPK